MIAGRYGSSKKYSAAKESVYLLFCPSLLSLCCHHNVSCLRRLLVVRRAQATPSLPRLRADIALREHLTLRKELTRPPPCVEPSGRRHTHKTVHCEYTEYFIHRLHEIINRGLPCDMRRLRMLRIPRCDTEPANFYESRRQPSSASISDRAIRQAGKSPPSETARSRPLPSFGIAGNPLPAVPVCSLSLPSTVGIGSVKGSPPRTLVSAPTPGVVDDRYGLCVPSESASDDVRRVRASLRTWFLCGRACTITVGIGEMCVALCEVREQYDGEGRLPRQHGDTITVGTGEMCVALRQAREKRDRQGKAPKTARGHKRYHVHYTSRPYSALTPPCQRPLLAPRWRHTRSRGREEYITSPWINRFVASPRI